MPINTAKTTGRRAVKYQDYGALLADAERCAASPTRMLGNWTLAQVYRHLALSLDSSMDGTGFSLPGPVRWMMSLMMKRKFLHQTIPAGYRSTAKFIPDDSVPLEAALADLKRAIQRVDTTADRAIHPAFGNLSREEWDLFNLRHAEMHMSFVELLEPK